MKLSNALTVSEAMRARYSVRGYLPDPIPEETIREVFDVARWAPSGTNTQAWHVTICSGDARNRLEQLLTTAFDNGDGGERDFPSVPDEVTGVYLDRRRACGFSYYETMGVERKDYEGRARIARKNFEFFGAPHVAFFSMPKHMGHSKALDMGLFVQSVMLLLTERGIGCIPQGALTSHSSLIRQVAPIPEGDGIMVGMSFGYIDEDALINTVRMPREPLDVVASFVS